MSVLSRNPRTRIACAFAVLVLACAPSADETSASTLPASTHCERPMFSCEFPAQDDHVAYAVGLCPEATTATVREATSSSSAELTGPATPPRAVAFRVRQLELASRLSFARLERDERDELPNGFPPFILLSMTGPVKSVAVSASVDATLTAQSGGNLFLQGTCTRSRE